MSEQRTLSTKINELRSQGFTLNFKIENEHLTCPEDETVAAKPDDIDIVSRHRFEGMSNPSDLSIIYAIQTASGKQGLLVDGYGAYNSEKVAEFIRAYDGD